ncbi:N-Acetylglucosamine-1-Phosphodiester Alpha-N-Acetylglucosaminidase [Manis pentadactyla]|nr:N-Acetylglucosamine-1-Phosphodiester Alpha-N-Acetylglucosaminidase [Manis pentadactyla]
MELPVTQLRGPAPVPLASLETPVLRSVPTAGTGLAASSHHPLTSEAVSAATEATLKPGELFLLTGTTWLALTLALVFLLLISSMANVSLLLSSRAERSQHLDGAYVYHPLQEMNGELLVAEKEQLGDARNAFKD